MATPTTPGKKVGKTAINILDDLPKDDEEKYKWKFILETKFDEVDKALLHKDVDLTTSSGGPYFAILDSTNGDKEKELLRVLHTWSSGLTAIEKRFSLNLVSKYKSAEKFKFYSASNEQTVWLAGEKETIDNFIKEFEKEPFVVGNGSDPGVKNDKQPKETPFCEVELTEDEQALIYLHRLWDSASLKRNQIRIKKNDETYFSASLQIQSDKTDKETVKQEVRDILKSLKLGMSAVKLSYIAKKITFLASEAVHKYVDGKLNSTRANIKCAWYVNANDKTVRIYAKYEWQAKQCAQDIENALVHDSIQVPPKLFENDKLKSSLVQVESKYFGKLRMQLSSSAEKLQYMCVDDILESFKQDLRTIFITRPLEVTDREKHAYCKMRFLLIKDTIEENFKVSIKEEENIEKKKYAFVIQGSPKSADAVFTELKTLVENVCIQNRDFEIDHHVSDVSEFIGEKLCTAEIEEIKSHKAYKATNLGGEATCHNWNLPNGNKIRILNADENWLVKGYLLLQVEIKDFENSVRYFELRPEKNVMVLYLPQRQFEMDQKKEILCTVFDTLHTQLPLVKHGYHQIALCLNEPQKHGWQWQTFLKQLLLSRDRHNITKPLMVLEPSKQLFTEASIVIQNYLSTIWNKQNLRIQIHVKPGELVREKVGAIVNSANEDLTLTSGAVSQSILKAAGDDIQKECERIMRKRNYAKLSSTNVVVTKGYKLPCELVLHGALASWYKQTLADFVYNCLCEAEKNQLSSIAFPSLGTGNLTYPPDRVASIMFETVNRYALSTNLGSLKHVVFVIYSQDTKSLQAFQDVQNAQEKARQCDVTLEKCPNPCFIRVTLAGGSKDEVEQTFSVLQHNIKERCHKHIPDLQEPTDVSMTRGNDFEYNQETSAIDDVGKEICSLPETEPTCKPTQLETPKEPNGIQTTQNENGNVSILIRILLPENQYACLVKELRKHNIHVNQVIWCPYTPQEAHVKMQDDTCAHRLMDALKSDERYKPSICSLEAVVNIRARLSSKMADFLRKRKELYAQLKKQSGVDVVRDEDDNTTLTGCLSEISAARGILLKWRDESDIPMVVDNKTATRQTKKEENISPMKPLQIAQELKDEGVKSNSSQKSNTNTGNLLSKVENKNAHKSTEIEHKMTELDDDTVIVDTIHTPPLPITRTVVADDNSLRIYFKNSPSNPQEDFPLSPGINQLGANTTDRLGFDKIDDIKQTSKDTLNRQHSNIEYGASEFQRFHTANDDSLMMTTKEGIRVFVYEGDMCNLNVDGIVNSSNEYMNHNYGLSAVISKSAGPEFIQDCQHFIKKRHFLSVNGICVASSGYLKQYKKILNVCSPVWDKRTSTDAFFSDLSAVIEMSLKEANKLKMKSIAIPAVGSGGRSGPRQLCFSTYPNGVILFSNTHGKTSTLKEVHFVDIDAEVVNLIQAACLLNPTEPGTEVKHKLQKIPESVKETFVSYIAEDNSKTNYVNIHLANNVHVTVCEGPLFTAFRHRHLKDGAVVGSDYEFTGVVVTEDKEFSGKSRSASHCLQRGGNDFHKCYEQLKKLKNKNKVGKVCHSFGDTSLNYGDVLYPVMPSFNKKVLKKGAEEQINFFGFISNCCRNVLMNAENWNIQHLCMPVLGEDFYSVTDTWFVQKCVADMIQDLREYAKNRSSQRPILVHIATKPTSVAFQVFMNELYGKMAK